MSRQDPTIVWGMSCRAPLPFAFALVFLSACGGIFGPKEAPGPHGVTLPSLVGPPPGATEAGARDAPAEAPGMADPGGAELGRVTVSLGDPTAPGFWLRSPLVKAARPGRVVTASGATVQVELLPGTGAAQMSLAAYRALNLSLTDLPPVTVVAD